MTISPAELAASGLRLDVADAVATVTLNRPERRNAMTPAVWRGLAAIGSGLPPGVRVVVVRGAGPSFCVRDRPAHVLGRCDPRRGLRAQRRGP